MKVTQNGRTLTFTFDGLEPVVFDADKASATVQAQATMHGFEQRIRDNAAIARRQKDGSIITVTEEMRRNAVSEMVTHLESGTESWNMRVARAAPQNAAILALANAMGVTYAEAEAHIAKTLVAEMQAKIDRGE